MKQLTALLLILTLSTITLARPGTTIKGASLERAPASAITLAVDATEVARKIIHARLLIPASPGSLTLLYPKWIPGEHGPTGPIVNLAGVKLMAGGQPVAWTRDPVDMYAFHCEVPVGANAVEAQLDFLLPANPEGFTSAASSTAQLAVINWNQVLLYPRGLTSDELTYTASLRLPASWKFGTALPVQQQMGDTINFQSVSLTTLVDSPLITGTYFRAVPLNAGGTISHEIDMVSDSPAALEMRPDLIADYTQLVAETGELFGARHYRGYHFLFTLSDHVASFGLEHHESSDDRVPERTLLDDDLRRINADLLPHEMTHSWNGKYRRPADLATANYDQPMQSDLLWVYEGLTQYLGWLLTARSGLWTNEEYREALAQVAAYLDNRPGRTWRPLVDTAVAAQLLYDAPGEWANWRRGVDFYDEGTLIWLEADMIIRRETGGRRSLDDFCRRFHGGQSGPPAVVTYTLDDVIKTLNEVAPLDWRAFFNTRVYNINPRAPLGGIEGGGWHLVYTDAPNVYQQSSEAVNKASDLSYSIGLKVNESGAINDVIPGGPAAMSGLGPGMKLVAVNGRRFSKETLHDATRATKTTTTPLELLVENGDFYKTYQLAYHYGERYPHLVRDTTRPDLLTQLLKPLARKKV